VPISVGNTPPVVSLVSPHDGDFFTPGEALAYKVAISDAEDGDSTTKGDEMGVRTLVSASWRSADGKVGETEPGLALMKASDCFNCHAVEQPLVGPPLVKIAEKYRGVAGAEDATVQRVLKGSTGVWGPLGMLPHAQLTEDELHIMVRWVYSLEAGKASPGMARGISGQISAPADDKATTCTLSASYTDGGRPPVGAITRQATVVLRSRKIEARMADEIHGPKITAFRVGGIEDKHWLKFAAINLGDTAAIVLRVSSEGDGGKAEIHVGSPTGEVIGATDIAMTGAAYADASATLAASKPSRGDVYLVFVRSTHTPLSVESVRFTKP
jgi:cytochrome c